MKAVNSSADLSADLSPLIIRRPDAKWMHCDIFSAGSVQAHRGKSQVDHKIIDKNHKHGIPFNNRSDGYADRNEKNPHNFYWSVDSRESA